MKEIMEIVGLSDEDMESKDLAGLDQEDEVEEGDMEGGEYDDELGRKLDRLFQQGDEAIERLDQAGRDFERSMDAFTDGIEKMFDVFEGLIETGLKEQ